MIDRVLRLPAACLGLLVALAAPAIGKDGDRPISASESRLREDVSFLADDAQEGRGVGTRGIDRAADRIAEVFREAGLKPAEGADGYFQPFEIKGEARLKPEAIDLTLRGPDGAILKGALDQDFSPLNLGGEGRLKDIPIVFAGYGITAKDENSRLDYDDYKGLDVRGKAVLVIRREPQLKDKDSVFNGDATSPYATFRHKARNAADHGATAVLLVNDAAGLGDAEDKPLDFAAAGGGGAGIPFLMISREMADAMHEKSGVPKLAELEKSIDDDLKPVSRPLEGWTLDTNVEISRDPIPVKNVVGVLEGEGPLADETIVVGAHYDHLGRGGEGSMALGSRDIHNGADDNASGTALIMELARRMSYRDEPLPRRIVFIAFSGEERGLLGSRHYVDHPLYPLDKTVAMLNFDMVGRLNGDDELTVYGVGSSPTFEPLVTAIAESQGLSPKLVRGRAMHFGASDHASFYAKNVPVLFAFTGLHGDYHRPSDDTDLVNFDGMRRIANLGELLLLDIALRPGRPVFTTVDASSPGSLARRRAPETEAGNDAHGHGDDEKKPAAPAQAAGPERAMPYMGTQPDYAAEDVSGVLLGGVTEGSPAEKAGLKKGDVIVKFGGKTVVDLEDFMEGLGERKAGDTVDVLIKRDGKEKALPVTLGTRGAQ